MEGSTVEYIANAPCDRRVASWTRWWVLFVFCLVSACQAGTWNCFGPIFPAVYLAFPSWSSAYLAWVINSANVTFALMLYPVSSAVQRCGPRRITLFSAAAVFFGSAVRCLPLADGTPQRVVMLLSMLCNGAGGPWLNFGAPLLSELWFPAHERTMATSIATVAVYAGGALGFVIGPAIVGSPGDTSSAHTVLYRLFWIEASVCLFALLCCVLYFPDRPTVRIAKLTLSLWVVE